MTRVGPKGVLVIAALLLTATVALLVRPFHPDIDCCDHLAYRSMSYNLFTVTRPDLNTPPEGNRGFGGGSKTAQYEYGLNRLPPYVYRVFTPLLARSLAYLTSIDAAYYAISFLALAAAAFLIGLSILELSGAVVAALAGMVLFIVNPWTGRFNLWDYMLTDPMAFFLVSLAIWALVKRMRLLFFAACIVGVLNKESMVPMVLAYPLSEAWIEHHIRPASIIVPAGIVLGYIVFRVLMPEAPTGYTIAGQFIGGVDHVKSMAGAGIITFGIVVPAALRRPWGSKLMVALMPFAIACVLEAWFVGNLGRAMVQALPVVCVGIFWRWPADLEQQLLTLAVLPLVLIQTAVIVFLKDGHPGGAPYETLILMLVAAAAELRLWRLQRRGALVSAPVTP